MRVKKISDMDAPDAWALFLMKSNVGESLLGQGKFVDAEPLLVEGYQGLKAREAKIGSSVPSALSRH